MPANRSKKCWKYLRKTVCKILISSLLALLIFQAFAFSTPGQPGLSDSSRVKKSGQLLVVISDRLDQKSGKLYFFQKTAGNWKRKIEPVQVMLGAHGMAWANDLTGFFKKCLPRKKEGDLCSPAGIYALNEAFSFDSIPLLLRLLVLHKASICIDDVNSSSYNKVVDSLRTSKDWNSAEKMRSTPEYKYGLIIDNENGSGRNGSCIFVHIWSGPGRSTAGCTAMKEEDLISILTLLDSKYFPVLVQLPLATYNTCKNRLGFPAL